MAILSGIKVLELCEVFQGPLAAQVLADFGADVIKIERPPRGDSLRRSDAYAVQRGLMSGYFAAANRNKKSVCLNLKSDAGKAAFAELVKDADVLLHNYRPGVMERLGFGYESLRTVNPGLIYAAASGFGETGPLSGLAGQDFLIQSITGIATKSADYTGTPNFLNVPITDFASGMLLAQGIAFALFERSMSGLGQKVTVSLFDTAIAMQSLEAASLLNYEYVTTWFDRSLNFVAQTTDGWVTVLGFFRDNPLELVCQALGIPDLSVELDVKTGPQQALRKEEIVAHLRPHFLALTTNRAVSLLQANGVLAAPVLTFAAALEHEQVAHNQLIKTIPVSGQSDMKVIGNPVCFSRTPQQMGASPPKLGAHTTEVLAQLGLSEAQISAASTVDS